MGFLNASPVPGDEAREKFSHLFRADETVEFAFKTVRDHVLFTQKRLILVDVQGITGSKKRYTSYPYRALTSFSIETSGTFDLEAEMTLTLSGHPAIELNFSRNSRVEELQRFLAERML